MIGDNSESMPPTSFIDGLTLRMELDTSLSFRGDNRLYAPVEKTSNKHVAGLARSSTRPVA